MTYNGLSGWINYAPRRKSDKIVKKSTKKFMVYNNKYKTLDNEISISLPLNQ